MKTPRARGEKYWSRKGDNANKVVDETQKSIGNLKPFYKKNIALPVKEDFTHLEKLK